MATMLEAHALWDRGEARAAFRIIRKWAMSGDETAIQNLGYMYDCGEGTRRTRRKAMYWYRRSYRLGSSASASNIATIYRDEGKPQLAFAWYKRAAEMGDGDAELELAKRYAGGVGVARHRGRAAAALKRALSTQFITGAARQEATALLKRLKAKA
jgi:TPR repeat protein